MPNEFVYKMDLNKKKMDLIMNQAIAFFQQTWKKNTFPILTILLYFGGGKKLVSYSFEKRTIFVYFWKVEIYKYVFSYSRLVLNMYHSIIRSFVQPLQTHI